jgi:hypothetical protein
MVARALILVLVAACGSKQGADVDASVAGDAATGDGAGDGGTQVMGDFCEEDGWCWQRPAQFGANLFAAWGSGPDDVWAAGAAGTLAHYDGQGWRLVASSTDADLFGVWGAGPQDVWAVGANGTVLHFDGSAWKAVTSPTTKRLNGIYGRSATEILAVGAEDTRMLWNGTAWTLLPTVYPSATIKPNQYGVWMAPSGAAWSAGVPYLQSIPIRTSAGMWETSTVANVGTTTFKGVWGASDSDVWIAGEPGAQGSLQRWNGQTWTAVYPPAAAALSAPVSITGSGPNDVWFFGGWQSSGRWNGTSFVPQPDLRYEYLTGGWVHPSGEGWAVGYGGRLAHKTMLEGSWTFVGGSPSGSYDSLAQLVVVGNDDVWAIGRLSLAHYNGSAWTEVEPATTTYRQEFNDAWASAPNDIWATSWGSNAPDNLQHWNGSAWTTTPHPGPSYLDAIWGSAPNDIWIAYSGGNGGMHYNGTMWETTKPGPGGDSTAMHGTASNDIWCVGYDGRVTHYNGTAWSAVTSGTTATLYTVLAVSATDAWIGGESSTLRRWNGSSWQAVTAPPITADVQGRKAITDLAGASNDLWASTSSGEVFHYDGSTWTRSARLSVGLTSIARTQAGALFTAGENGAVLRRAP